MKIKTKQNQVTITTDTQVVADHLTEYLQELESAMNRGYGKVTSTVHEDYLILEVEKKSRKKRNRFST